MSVYSKKFSKDIDLNNDSTHASIINYVGSDKKVLDVGCSSGYLAGILKNQFNCEVYGIELDAEDAELAKAHCKEVYTADIETFDLDSVFEKQQFDVIIFADVLEHLNDPKAVLKKVEPYLKGSLIVSIPNIAHASIIFELLNGQFKYTPMGLLDETHKKFFTKDSFEELLLETGFSVHSVKSTKVDPELSEKKTNLNEYPEKVVEYVNSLQHSLDYQYIFKAFVSNPDIQNLKKEIEVYQNERRRLIKNHHQELAELKQQNHKLQESIDWYKKHFKENLQITSENSSQIIKLKKELSRAEHYSADHLPALLAYPLKAIIVLCRYGIVQPVKYLYRKYQGEKAS